MRKTRWFAAFLLPLLLVSFLQSQSLADLAKKEKERRAALKGKPAKVITEVELAKVKKRPAVESAAQGQVTEEAAAETGAAEGAAQEGVQAAETAAAGTQPAQAVAPPAAKPVEELPPGETPAASAQDIQKKITDLTDAAQQKAEMVDLLTTKMNALYQEFYSLDNMKSRELVQIQISDTYDKLLKAEADSAKAQKDLEDFMAQAKKEKTPAIWIK